MNKIKDLEDIEILADQLVLTNIQIPTNIKLIIEEEYDRLIGTGEIEYNTCAGIKFHLSERQFNKLKNARRNK